MPTTVWVTADTLAYCEDEAASAYPDETGGVLMGWHRPERAEVVVVHAVGPGNDGVHEAHRFEPDNRHHLAVVGDIYQRSGRKVTYLGDWHSHPGGSATLSRTDRRTVGNIASHPPSRCPEPLMIVLAGGAEDGWHAAAHVWAPRRLILWEVAATQRGILRTWTPEPGDLDTVGYPYG